MSRHEDEIRLAHMLDHAIEAVALCSHKGRTDLDTDRLLNLALVRLIEIVGEAANRVTPATRDKLLEIPWKEIVGMRNRIVHGYDAVDFDILWTVVTQDLPPLITRLSTFLGRS